MISITSALGGVVPENVATVKCLDNSVIVSSPTHFHDGRLLLGPIANFILYSNIQGPLDDKQRFMSVGLDLAFSRFVTKMSADGLDAIRHSGLGIRGWN